MPGFEMRDGVGAGGGTGDNAGTEKNSCSGRATGLPGQDRFDIARSLELPEQPALAE